MRAVGAACDLSESEVSRIERGLRPRVTVRDLARLHAVVGLDLSMRSYPGGPPIRDAAQASLLEDLHVLVHRVLRWATEVPLPIHGDQRAWDAMISGPDWRIGVEAETAPTDSQALLRRLALKERDGSVDGVILLVRPTRQGRRFIAEAGPSLSAAFPLSGIRALELLRAGVQPEGNALIVMPWRRREGPVGGLAPVASNNSRGD